MSELRAKESIDVGDPGPTMAASAEPTKVSPPSTKEVEHMEGKGDVATRRCKLRCVSPLMLLINCCYFKY